MPEPSAHLHSRLIERDVKAQKPEPSKTGCFLKQEPDVERSPPNIRQEPRPPLCQSCSPIRATQDRHIDEEAPKPQPLPLYVPSLLPHQDEKLEDVKEDEKEAGQIKMEVLSYSCQAAFPLPPPLTEAEAKPQDIKEAERTPYSPCITAEPHCQESDRSHSDLLERTASAVCEQERHHDTPRDSHTPSQKEISAETQVSPAVMSNSPLPLVTHAEDPMTGLFTLLTACEMANQSRSETPPAPILLPQVEILAAGADCSSAGSLEMVALEGMALLAQMTPRDVEQISLEQGE